MAQPGFNEEQIYGDVVMALLAVNGWTLEKVSAIRDGLAREALFDREALKASSIQVLAERLHAAGYTRGDYMCSLLAHRLQSFAEVFDDDVARDMKIKLESKRLEEVDKLLLAMHGVGPTVLWNFKILVGLEQ